MIVSRLVVPAALVSLAFAAVACGTVPLGGADGDGDGGALLPDASSMMTDAGARDATMADATAVDATTPDGAVTDASSRDAAPVDAAAGEDAGDGAPPDTTPDSGSPDWVIENVTTRTFFLALGGSGPNDVYVSLDNQILHSTGDGTWTKDLDTNENQTGVFTFATLGPGRMFAGTDGYDIIYRDPTGTTEWTAIGTCKSPNVHGPPQGTEFGTTIQVAMGGSVAYAADGDTACTMDNLIEVVDGGVANDPPTQQVYTSPGYVSRIFTSSTGAAYLGGADANGFGFAAHASGKTWLPLTVPASGPIITNGAAFGDAAWFLAGSVLYKSSSFGALTVVHTFATGETMTGVWATGDDDVWVVGAGTYPEIVHLQGANATTYALPGVQYPLTAVWGSGPTDIYAISRGSEGTFTGGSLVHSRF